MTEQIDNRIAALESELADLKRKKIAILQSQVAAIQASLSGAPSAAPAAVPFRRPPGRPRKVTASSTGWVADLGKAKPSSSGWAADLAKVKPSSGGWVADMQAANAKAAGAKPAAAKPAKQSGPKKRGRKPGKRVPDEQVIAAAAKLVAAAGKEGISARKVAQATGIHYPRLTKLMDIHFKKTGERKWSRYHLKK